jgi:hypothetical protein
MIDYHCTLYEPKKGITIDPDYVKRVLNREGYFCDPLSFLFEQLGNGTRPDGNYFVNYQAGVSGFVVPVDGSANLLVLSKPSSRGEKKIMDEAITKLLLQLPMFQETKSFVIPQDNTSPI